jgi:5'-nucleotidase (lipoprotein e(P4) family)
VFRADELNQIVSRINDALTPQLGAIKDDTTAIRSDVAVIMQKLDNVSELLTAAITKPEQARETLKPLLVEPTLQFLYGSGEAAALSRQAYNLLVDAVRRRLDGEKSDPGGKPGPGSAILRADATLERPTTVDCGNKPNAVVFDIDETLLLNLGYEYYTMRNESAFDLSIWENWEKTGAVYAAPVPGAVEALNDLRKLGVTVIFNSNRSAGSAAFTSVALDYAGLGPAVHGETLYLAGDAGGGSRKDARRAVIAARYCVVAMAGDQLSDFSDLFNATQTTSASRRALPQSAALSGFWGRLWFMLPNPVYGAALRGTLDDVFPFEKRWPGPPRAD